MTVFYGILLPFLETVLGAGSISCDLLRTHDLHRHAGLHPHKTASWSKTSAVCTLL